MDDRGWRTIALVLALVCALLLGITGALVMQGGGASASPTAARASATAVASVAATASAQPSSRATSSPTATATPSAKPSATSTPAPTAPVASIKFTGLALDAETDAGATARTFTFMSDGWGAVTARVTATSGGQTKMCITVDGQKAVCPKPTAKPAMLNGFADTVHSLWTITLIGVDVSTPTVDVVFTWRAATPEIRLTHGRFQGEGAADALNGIAARFTSHAAGTVGLQASWTVLQTDAKATLTDVTGTPTVKSSKQYSGVSTLNPPFSAAVAANRTYLLELRNTSADNERPDLSVTVSFPA